MNLVYNSAIHLELSQCKTILLTIMILDCNDQEFVNAVNAWRNRGSKVSSQALPQGDSMTSSKIPLGTASSSAIALAAKLSIELEDEEKQLKMIINEKKKNLEANMRENRSRNSMQNENKDNESSASMENEFDTRIDLEQFSSEAKYYPSSSERNNHNNDNDDKNLMEKATKGVDVIMSLENSKIGKLKIPQGMPYKGELTAG